MINRLLGNSKQAHAARYCHQRKQVKHDSRSPKISQRTGSGCCEGITSVIEAFVASDSLGEGSMSKDAERDGCKDRTRHRPHGPSPEKGPRAKTTIAKEQRGMPQSRGRRLRPLRRAWPWS